MAINYGEMKVKVTPRGVMSGRIGVSGPPNDDYENLINKPQINGVMLIGDKSNADLGIPTELADLTDDETHRTVTDEDIETWNAKSDFSGSYNDLTDVPNDLVEDGDYVHTDNNYTNSEKSKLEGIESGAEANVQSDWNEIDYSKDSFIKNKPDIPTALKDLSDDSTHRLVTDSNISTWNAKSDFSGSYNDLTNKPAIPDELKDLQDDTTHRLVTDTEKTTWNNKSDFSGSYNDLTNKPTIPDAQIQSDWEQSDNSKKDYIKNKPQNLVSDADYVHTDNDYSDTDKAIVSGITSALAGKVDKVTNATNGNLAGLNGSGNLTDSGWASDKTTTSASGNPISITGLKSNQLAVNPVITFEPIQAGSGDPSPSNVRAISGYDKIEVLSANGSDPTAQGYVKTTDLSENLPQTVYGGSLDVRTGKLTVDRAIVDLGNLSWTIYNNFTTTVSGIKNYAIYTNPRIKCEMYKPEITGWSTYHNNKDNVIYQDGNSSNIFIRDTSVATTSALVTKVTGKKLVYELAAPFTIQLTPHEISLLKDYAYVTTNGTTISLDYHNGEIATLGDVAQLGETVENANSHILDDIIGDTSTLIPDTNIHTITDQLAKMPAYVHVSANGGGTGLCDKNGFYFVIARHNTDTSAYYIGFVYKAPSSNPVITEIASNLISIRAYNTSGTISFNYNGTTGLGNDGKTSSYRFLGNAIF